MKMEKKNQMERLAGHHASKSQAYTLSAPCWKLIGLNEPRALSHMVTIFLDKC